MLKILDCTLRDGGYHNEWDFPVEIVNEYLQAMYKSDIDIVEIGFRTLINSNYKGPLAFSTEDYLNNIIIPEGLEIAVMVNASDFFQNKNNKLSLKEQIEHLFPFERSKSKLTFVRVACHINEFEETLPIANFLHDKGYKVGFNIMQFSEINESLIKNFCEKANNYPIDVLYFADSLGTLTPLEISELLTIIKKNWSKELGVHTHNNLGLALQNSIEAIKNGVNYVDSTVTGMGRGPGNAKTEELLYETQTLREKKFNFFALTNIITNYFKPLQKKLDWGDNFFYYLAGKKKIHPTYIQEILKNSSYSNNDILAFIDYLSNIDAKKYKFNKLDDILDSYYKKIKSNSNVSLPNNEKVLIIGNGNSIHKYKHIIEDYIKKNNIFVICLNTHDPVDTKLINIRTACHPIRIISDFEKYQNFEQPLVIPFSMLKDLNDKKIKTKQIHDYSIILKRDNLKAGKHSATIPNYNVFGYSLAIAIRMSVKKIEIAGFDGFDILDFRHKEVQDIINLFKTNYSEVSLISLTPTTYELEQKSIYALN